MRSYLSLLALLIACAPAAAQQPRIANARLQARPVAGSLERDVRAVIAAQRGAAWLGYAVPMVPGEHRMCCFNSNDDCCGRCTLERGTGGGVTHAGEQRTVRLEGPRTLLVLYRIEQAKVDRIRVFSEECELDAGGLDVHWLTDARAADSVALLASYAKSGEADRETRRISDGAVAAIALHGDASADAALEQFVAPGSTEGLRERASFWLGNARGRRGYEILRKLVREDASDRVREKAIFALTQSREPEALTTMIDVAKNDRSTRVRGQALFWLGQKAGQKATQAITDAIADDPETEVKKKAVFALSQLPKDEGVPMLIQVARTNKNPEVRKQAMFWLGQSRDPRALTFFEEILR